jgi:hypothetical protein
LIVPRAHPKDWFAAIDAPLDIESPLFSIFPDAS